MIASTTIPSISSEHLSQLGLDVKGLVHYQNTPEELVASVLERAEGKMADNGSLVIQTGKFMGRSPKDKFIVRDETTSSSIFWNNFNLPIESNYFDAIFEQVTKHLSGLEELYVRDCFACADSKYRLNIRIINEKPANNLFAYNMFLRPTEEELETFAPEWIIYSAPGLLLDTTTSGTPSENAAVINFKRKIILIAGTAYTGEIKKGIFTILNYILPYEKQVLSMHCSANIGEKNDTALFFGLSGTGKTTLSADASRKLVGDDEHGWSDTGIFNFEGGCYAKCFGLSDEKEPEIFNAIKVGSLVENTCFYPDTTTINFDDISLTENTRVSYPLHYITNAMNPSIGSHPKNIFFLTCDASGVLPPISKLSNEQAMYHYISGYTAKVAGTEMGVTEPKATFSACFGAPFLPLHPGKYAAMLGEKLKTHKVNVWLINTGWTGGPYGIGNRIKLSYTRAMINAALEGNLEYVNFEKSPIFNLETPDSCPGVPDSLLNPKNTWLDKDMYDIQLRKLASLFVANFEQYQMGVSPEIRAAAPTL
jgi:phosphoenolpyruvate carboxykinase (ATP)